MTADLIADEIVELTAKAHTMDETARKFGGQYINLAMSIGDILHKIKSKLPHGEFGKWCTENLKFSPRSRQKYMWLADRRGEIFIRQQKNPRLSMTDIVDQLSTPKAHGKAHLTEAKSDIQKPDNSGSGITIEVEREPRQEVSEQEVVKRADKAERQTVIEITEVEPKAEPEVAVKEPGPKKSSYGPLRALFDTMEALDDEAVAKFIEWVESQTTIDTIHQGCRLWNEWRSDRVRSAVK